MCCRNCRVRASVLRRVVVPMRGVRTATPCSRFRQGCSTGMRRRAPRLPRRGGCRSHRQGVRRLISCSPMCALHCRRAPGELACCSVEHPVAAQVRLHRRTLLFSILAIVLPCMINAITNAELQRARTRKPMTVYVTCRCSRRLRSGTESATL